MCVTAIFFTYSRGALLALVGMFAFYAILHAPTLRKRPGHVVALLAILAAVAVMAPALYFERAQELIAILPGHGGASQSADPAIRGRFGEMAVAWQMFLDHPLLGVGTGNYTPHFQEYNLRLHLMPRGEPREAHSLYLEIAAERGLLGLSVFVALLALLGKAVIRARRRFLEGGGVDYANMAGALGVGWIGYGITALFLHDAYPHYFWLLVGVTLALPQVAEYEGGGSVLSAPPD